MPRTTGEAMPVTLYVIDNSHANSTVMSGGERIAIEMCKQWADSRRAEITVIGSNLTTALWDKYLEDQSIRFFHVNRLREEEYLFLSYLKRVIKGIASAIRFRMKPQQSNIIYTASDFWPDSLPGFIMFLRNRKRARWIAGFYLFAPSPFRGFREGGSLQMPSIRTFIYWLSQKPVYYIVRRFASAVFVTSEPDAEAFITPRRPRERVIVVRGGVDLAKARTNLTEEGEGKESFDAVFVGRFHPQKGVVELIDIWKMVCDQIPGAKLAIIGTGPLEEEVRQKIKDNNLEEEVNLLGFLDGTPKYEIFQRSKLVLHPALYDSGGMAAAEAMAWALPGVAYDLQALKSYYPRGMVKVPIGKTDEFATAIVELLRDKESRDKLGQEARDMVVEEWSWQGQADRIWMSLKSAGLVS
jgi:glycosyltransferase involved in cell wall biosynthesis